MEHVKRRDDLVEKVFEEIKERETDWRRGHLGASGVGADCLRKSWLNYRWVMNPKFEGRTLALFDRGNREEETFEKRINDTGSMRVTSQQNSYSRHFGHFGGSIDGAIRVEGDGWYLGEFKTYNTSRFKALGKVGVRASDPVYYVQVQMYMGLSGLERTLFWAVCKENDQLHCEEVIYDQDTFEHYLSLARELIYSEEMPKKISNKANYYKCNWCPYQRFCHSNDQSQIETNCRTCSNGRPALEGRDDDEWRGDWVCEQTSLKTRLTIINQKEGCENYSSRFDG